jgi:hypothetical protein
LSQFGKEGQQTCAYAESISKQNEGCWRYRDEALKPTLMFSTRQSARENIKEWVFRFGKKETQTTSSFSFDFSEEEEVICRYEEEAFKAARRSFI